MVVGTDDIGFWHSLVVFFVPYVMLHINPVVHQNSQPLELLAFSCVVFHNVVVVVNLKLLMQSRHWTFPFVFSIIISVLGFIVIALAYSSILLNYLASSPVEIVAIYQFPLLQAQSIDERNTERLSENEVANFYFEDCPIPCIEFIAYKVCYTPLWSAGKINEYHGKLKESLIKDNFDS
ncbi:Uncharacterized protein GBIM_00391 [Gryllus bimaculatus]|nr:Uncharacterized protein GBIM_00391 [Gryllus bimaculatus]